MSLVVSGGTAEAFVTCDPAADQFGNDVFYHPEDGHEPPVLVGAKLEEFRRKSTVRLAKVYQLLDTIIAKSASCPPVALTEQEQTIVQKLCFGERTASLVFDRRQLKENVHYDSTSETSSLRKSLENWFVQQEIAFASDDDAAWCAQYKVEKTLPLVFHVTKPQQEGTHSKVGALRNLRVNKVEARTPVDVSAGVKDPTDYRISLKLAF